MKTQRRTVEECYALDVRNMVRENSAGWTFWGPPGRLIIGGKLGIVSTVVRWRREESPELAINLETTSLTCGNPTPWEQSIVLASRPCSGRLKIQGRIVPPPAAAGSYNPALRYCYLCPRCGRRCGVLYLPRPCGRPWGCRRCWDLAYESQSRSKSIALAVQKTQRRGARNPPFKETVAEMVTRLVMKRCAARDAAAERLARTDYTIDGTRLRARRISELSDDADAVPVSPTDLVIRQRS